ncbi:MAG: lysophospholipid acyltransferase family protein [Acidobacteriota bacterium]
MAPAPSRPARELTPAEIKRQHRLARGVSWILSALGATWRVELVAGKERLEAIRRHQEPVVFAFWHNGAPISAWLLRRWFLSRGVPLTVLVSQSRDGELGAGLAIHWGAKVVRGSASRGGAAGLRRLYREVRKGSNAITIPDGPRGPIFEAKPGAVVLSQLTGAAIQPMAIAVDRAWRAKSWDRMIFPKPFARVRVAFGDPIAVPNELTPPPAYDVEPGVDGASLEAWQRYLSQVLNRLVERVKPDSGDSPSRRPGISG